MRRMNMSSLWLVILAALLLASTAVVCLLCSRALETQRRASELSAATVAAGSAAELYYASDSAAELAERLSGALDGETVSASCGEDMELRVLLSEENGLQMADISVLGSEGEIFSMSCLKAAEAGGQ